MDCVEVINSLINDLQAIQHPYPKQQIDLFERRTKMLLEQLFGKENDFQKDIDSILHPSFGVIYFDAPPEVWERQHIAEWVDRKPNVLNVFHVILEHCKLSNILKHEEQSQEETMNWGRQVFLVHGHDGELKERVARMLERLNFRVTILHEQADGGKTIIEKLLAHAENVGFAVVLATADDLGFSRREQPSDAKPRARQNVILELGIFVAKLGRDRVFLLREDGVEIPSDFAGVLYTPYDGSWPAKLVQELQHAGYEVDANLLLR